VKVTVPVDRNGGAVELVAAADVARPGRRVPSPVGTTSTKEIYCFYILKILFRLRRCPGDVVPRRSLQPGERFTKTSPPWKRPERTKRYVFVLPVTWTIALVALTPPVAPGPLSVSLPGRGPRDVLTGPRVGAHPCKKPWMSTSAPPAVAGRSACSAPCGRPAVPFLSARESRDPQDGVW